MCGFSSPIVSSDVDLFGIFIAKLFGINFEIISACWCRELHIHYSVLKSDFEMIKFKIACSSRHNLGKFS